MSKGHLTPEEQLRVSVAVLCDGVDQHVVASLMGVNHGRVNEAVQKARHIFGFRRNPKSVTLVTPAVSEEEAG